MPTNVHHREPVDAEPVFLPIVATETVIRNAIAVVTAALLPGAVLRLPATCAITLPRDLLLALLSRAALLRRPVVLLPKLLPLLILLPSGLPLLLACGIVPLLPLFILPPGLLLLTVRGVVPLLLLLPLLILLPPGLLLLFVRGVVSLLLPLILLPPGLLLLSIRGVVPLLLLLPLLI